MILVGRTLLSDAFEVAFAGDFFLRPGLVLLSLKAKSKASDRACPERSRRECPTHTALAGDFFLRPGLGLLELKSKVKNVGQSLP